MAEAKILKDLSASLEIHARSATFACGGSVSFKTAVETTQETDKVATRREPNANSPDGPKVEPALATIDNVQIHFGPSGEGFTVVFGENGPSSSEDFDHLLKAYQPASFGRGGEAVLDEEYRKAGKLDRSQFATSFCPYEAGIVDVVTQLLVPQYKHGRHTRSIKAELYKLNVYSAPNGNFKPHVDTPRSEDQIGSLVVCLPSAHPGGQLSISNAGATSENVTFHWSTEEGLDPTEIKWAAFYSDCEHEVHEVTSGHRVTLTYNLFLTRGAGHLAGASSTLDSTQLPLYDVLDGALDQPSFFRRGRVLALYLNHCYAHTSAHVNFLPDSLKGADMSLWNTAKALGLKCLVVPVMRFPYNYDHDGDTHVYEPKFGTFNGPSYGGFQLGECGQSWGYEMPDTKLTWLNSSGEKSKKCSTDKSQKEPRKAKPDFKEVQMAYLAYGNEPDIDIHYSHAAMLIRMPPYHERNTGKEPKSIWENIKLDPSEYEDWGYNSDEFSYSSSDGLEDEEMEEDDDDDGDDEQDDGGETTIDA